MGSDGSRQHVETIVSSNIYLHKEAAMIITLKQAILPQLFVHYRFTDSSYQPCPMCCTMHGRDEDQPEPSK